MRTFKIIFILPLLLILGACSDNSNKPVEYEEEIITPPPPQTPPPENTDKSPYGTQPMSPHGSVTPAELNFSFEAPEGWEYTNLGSSVRLINFKIPGIEECAIFRLGKGAKPQALCRLWMSQLGMNVSLPVVVDNFLKKQSKIKTAGKWDATLMDFSSLFDKPDNRSLFAAIVSTSECSLVLKFIAKRSIVEANLTKLKHLVRSFEPKVQNKKVESEK